MIKNILEISIQYYQMCVIIISSKSNMLEQYLVQNNENK